MRFGAVWMPRNIRTTSLFCALFPTSHRIFAVIFRDGVDAVDPFESGPAPRLHLWHKLTLLSEGADTEAKIAVPAAFRPRKDRRPACGAEGQLAPVAAGGCLDIRARRAGEESKLAVHYRHIQPERRTGQSVQLQVSAEAASTTAVQRR